MKFTKDIWIMLIASFFYMCATMMINPIIAGYAGSLGASASLMGFIGGLQYIAALSVRPFTGQLSDTITKQKLSAIGLIILIFATAGYLYSKTPAMLVFFRIAGGLGFSCITVCMSTWLSGLFPKEKLGYGMGIYGMVNAVCLAVGPMIGVELYSHVSYRCIFLVSLGMLVSCFISIMLISDKGKPLKKERKKLEIIDVNVIPIALIVICLAMPYFAAQTFLVKYIEELELDISVSLFFPSYAIALVVLRMLFRNSFDTVPFKRFFYICLASEGISILLLGAMKGNTILLLAAVFMAGGYGLMCSVSQSTAMLMADYEKRGLANSTYMFGLDIGTALGALTGGLVFGGIPLKFFFYIYLLIVPAAFLIYFVSRKKFEVKEILD